MNGSLPPISRFARATRWAQATATRLPVSTEPVNATQSTRSSWMIASPTSPAPAIRFTTPAGRWSKQRREHQRRQRRQLGGLADRRVAGGQRRRELPGQQQQRVVPGHDAADHAHRLLQHQRELRRLDRGDHAAGAVAPDLRVVVERGRRPADLVGVLEQRLAALERHHARQLVGARAQPRGHLVQHLAALDRGRARPSRGPPREPRPTAASICSARRQRDGRDRLLRVGVLDLERRARPRRPARRRSAAASRAQTRSTRSVISTSPSSTRCTGHLAAITRSCFDLLVGEGAREASATRRSARWPSGRARSRPRPPGRRRPTPCGPRTSRS